MIFVKQWNVDFGMSFVTVSQGCQEVVVALYRRVPKTEVFDTCNLQQGPPSII